MLVEIQRKTKSPPLQVISAAMGSCQELHISPTAAFQVLERMVDEGSRFLNFENILGAGAAFVLSHEGSDSLYVKALRHDNLSDFCRGTKLVPKSGPKFDRVVLELQNAEVGRLAKSYADLRQSVTKWYHDSVLFGHRGMPVALSMTALPAPSLHAPNEEPFPYLTTDHELYYGQPRFEGRPLCLDSPPIPSPVW